LSASVLSPDLNIGITLAILSWLGIVPEDNDKLKICLRGAEIDKITFFMKNIEMPLKSSLFLGSNNLQASLISDAVTGSLVRLNDTGLKGTELAGARVEGLMSLTIFTAAVRKKLLK